MKKVLRCPGCGERRQASQVTWHLQLAPPGMPRVCGGCCIGHRAILRAISLDPDAVKVADVPLSKFMQGLRQVRQDELAVKRAVRQEMWGTRERTRSYFFHGVEYQVLRQDHQRQRAYDAENEAFKDFPIRPKSTVADAQLYVNQVIASPIWAAVSAEHGTKRTAIEVKGGKRSGAYARAETIGVSSWACARKHVLLHELAHCAADYNVSHHWPWANAYLRLVGDVLGPEWEARLRESFDKHKVKYGPPDGRP